MPTRKLDDYLVAIRSRGIAPKFKFSVEITAPAGGTQDLVLNCTDAELPARQFTTLEYRYAGPVKKLPVNVFFDDLSLTFLCDGDFTERKYFERWMSLIYDDRYNLKYFDSYQGTIKVIQHNLQNEAIYAVRIFGAYPIALEVVTLSASATDYQSAQVRFTYRDWESVSATTSGVPPQ